MAATIRLHIWTGAAADTDGGSAASFSFLTADSALDTLEARINDPITIPASGCVESYEKWINACVSVAPANSVSTFEAWGTFPGSAAPTGTEWFVGTAACTAGSAPCVTTSSTATTDLASATSDSKFTWDSASYAAAGCQTAYLVNQLAVSNSACVGNWGACSLSYSYSEI